MKPPLPSPERNVEVVAHGGEPMVYAPPLAIEQSHEASTDEQVDQPNLVHIGEQIIAEQIIEEQIIEEQIIEEQIIEEVEQPPEDTDPTKMILVGPVNSNSMDPQSLQNLGLV